MAPAPLYIKNNDIDIETLMDLHLHGCKISIHNNFYKIAMPIDTQVKKHKTKQQQAIDEEGRTRVLITHSTSYYLPKGLCILFRRMALSANSTLYRCTLDVGMDAVQHVVVASFE